MRNQGSGDRNSWAVPITVALITALSGILVALINNPEVIDRFVLKPAQQAVSVENALPAAEQNQQPAEQQSAAEPSPDASAEESSESSSDASCVVTISNELVPLKLKPDTFSQDIIRVPPGEYTITGFQEVPFGSIVEMWYQILADGESGWIKNDTWTIADKAGTCP
jgi:hypothetical protein